jgi:predicted RNA polymerase sigma factor
MTAADIHAAILAAWRIEQPRLITSLSRMLRDVPLAEELTQDALVAALEAWPASGVPERPGAWLMATAKRRALDQIRRARCSRASTRCWRTSWSGSRTPCPTSTLRSMTISVMKCCG